MSSNGPEISKSRRVGLILFSLLLQLHPDFYPAERKLIWMDYMPSWRRGEERDAIKQRCWQIYATGYRRHSEKERGETALQTPDNHLKRRR